MKKILLVASFFCSYIFAAHAQEEGELVSVKSFLAVQDSLLQHLDKEKVATGVLYDRVYPIAQLAHLLTNDEGEIKTSFHHAKQAWYELYRAAYQNGEFLPIEQAEDIITENFINQKGISLGYLAFDFNTIDSNAFQNGALIMGADSLVYDGEGNPYLGHHISLPLVGSSGISGDEAMFYLDPRLQMSNNNKILHHAELSVEGKAPIMIGLDESAPFDISGITDSVIKLKVTLYWEGISLAESFEVSLTNGNLTPVSSVTTSLCTDTVTSIWSGTLLMFQGYSETTPAQGKGE